MTNWETDHRLTDMLAEIARQDEQIAPPSRIEQRVLASWDARVARPARHERERFGDVRRAASAARSWILLGSVGVAVAAVAIIIVRDRQQPVVGGAPPISAGADTSSRISADVPSGMVGDARAPGGEAAGTAAAMSIGDAVPATVVPAAEELEQPAEFYPIRPDALQVMSGPVRVARVRLPREVLADLGVVPDINRVGESVQADVVFGEDGVARAIRLVPVTWRSR
jgi:hypothetical protein